MGALRLGEIKLGLTGTPLLTSAKVFWFTSH
jgi:hypothetical protein